MKIKRSCSSLSRKTVASEKMRRSTQKINNILQLEASENLSLEKAQTTTYKQIVEIIDDDISSGSSDTL